MHQVFDDTNFYRAFGSDLAKAQALVIMHSPYLAVNRIELIRNWLVGCVRRRVRVCAFLRTPKSSEQSDVEEMASQLLSMGVHVTFRPWVHEKLAVIDEQILWEGSLNILNQSKSSERMNRWSSREKVYDAVIKHQLNGCETCTARRPFLTETDGSQSDELKWIGAKIACRRKSLGLTQIELSERTGVRQSAISSIEAGTYAASMDTMIRLSRELRLGVQFVPWYSQPTLDELFDEQRLDQCRIAMDTTAIDIEIVSLRSGPMNARNTREYTRLLALRSTLQASYSIPSLNESMTTMPKCKGKSPKPIVDTKKT